eukprot:4696931-Amphidinium_carterae.1
MIWFTHVSSRPALLHVGDKINNDIICAVTIAPTAEQASWPAKLAMSLLRLLAYNVLGHVRGCSSEDGRAV